MTPRTARALGATLASVVLCRLTVSPFHYFPLVPVCWVPFILSLDGQKPIDAVKLGLLHGTLLNAAAFTWLFPALARVAGLSLPGATALFALFAVVQGGRTALLAACVAFGTRGRLTPALLFPLSLVVSEQVYPYVFPWQVAIFCGRVVEWLQWAEFGGPLAVSLWVGAANAALAAAWHQRHAGISRWLPRVLAACCVVGVVSVSGRSLVRYHTARAANAPVGHVAIIQGNAGVKRHSRIDPIPLYRRETLNLIAQQAPIDFAIWPETALSQPIADSELRTALRDSILRDASNGVMGPRIAVPLLFGVVVQADSSDASRGTNALPEGSLTNSAVLADARGRILGRYDKRELVPFGERDALPFVPLLNRALRAVTTFAPGVRRDPPKLHGHPLSVSICYEDILREEFRNAIVASRPELLVNLTSDAWFAGSAAPELHLALAALRAVEHRRYLVRATDSGISAVIDPTGNVVLRLPENRVATTVARVRYLTADTLYEKLGDTPWTFTSVLVLFWASLGAWARARRADDRGGRTPN